MPSLLTIRFPNGETEHRYSSAEIKEGSVIMVGNRPWIVTSVDGQRAVCTVAPMVQEPAAHDD
jgi:hypothetical protein